MTLDAARTIARRGAIASTRRFMRGRHFAYTTCVDQTFTVPAGVTSLHAFIVAAPGADVSGGGWGGLVECDIPVTPGETLTVRIGARGGCRGAGSPGTLAAGGGASSIWRGGTLLAIAGGGGGRGGGVTHGGDGGGTTGADGSIGSAAAGTGGSSSAGGSGGAAHDTGTAGTAGSSLQGGNGGSGNGGGGGGGGGYYGGGGGGGSFSGTSAGGGGGSSHTDSGSVTGVVHTRGWNGGPFASDSVSFDGYIDLTFFA